MAKTLLFTGFRSRHDLRFFGKRVNTSVFCVHQGKKSVQKVQKMRRHGQKTVNPAFQHPKVAKTPLFTVFRAFHVFLKLQKPSKYQHFLRSTRQKVQFTMFFCFAFKNTGICSVLCIFGLKSISIFCVFALLPQKTLKRKNAVIYSILSISKSWNLFKKCVKTALLSDFRYPQKGGGMLLETLMSDPDSSQKALPHPPERFLVFFGARRRRVGGLGRASP